MNTDNKEQNDQSEIVIHNWDQHIKDLRTTFGMCHEKVGGYTVFKCATVCADLPNCPSKIVPKGQYDARVRQIEQLGIQSALQSSEEPKQLGEKQINA
jgi:hypothetical protein